MPEETDSWEMETIYLPGQTRLEGSVGVEEEEGNDFPSMNQGDVSQDGRIPSAEETC